MAHVTVVTQFQRTKGANGEIVVSPTGVCFDIVQCKERLHNDADTLSCVPCEQCSQVIKSPMLHGNYFINCPTRCLLHSFNQKILFIEVLKQCTYPTIQHHTLESWQLLQLWDQLLLKKDVLFYRLPSPTGQGLCDKSVVWNQYVSKCLRN